MEEESQCLKTNGEEDFYENIEAPKFVDLNAPDHYHPGDDRYWFCLRVGCEQKHEEEMDSEAIYKKFVLRVMAARSPNIRLRRALYRKDSSANIKCPQTVPAKSSKPRVSRLALISSISKRMVDPKVRVKSLAKQNTTPNVRAKQSVVSKALTTPRNKKRLSNPDAFCSVRNPKATAVAVPNSRVVAKALFSPKKSTRTKTSIELDTTVKKICAGIKNLEIADGKKHALVCNRQLPSNAPRKQPRGREVKSRVYDGLLSQNCKGKESKSFKCVMKKNKGKNSKQCHGPMPREGAENDFIDMEIEEKSRNGFPGACYNAKCDEGNDALEGPLTTVKIEASMVENKVEALSDAKANTPGCNEPNQRLYSRIHERGLGENDVPKLVASREDGNGTNERNGKEDKRNSSMDNGIDGPMESNDSKHIFISDEKENDREAIGSDNKENASASDDNREMDLNTGHLKRQILSKHESVKSTQKIAKAKRKPSKESFVTHATGAQELKHRKPKPTNPKPFRLRTGERGILKEATSEKKLHPAPLKEILPVTRFPGGNLQKKHQNALPRNDKSLEQIESANDTQEACEVQRNTTQKEQHQNQTSSLKNKERARRKLSSAPQRHTVSSQQKLVAPLKKYSEDKTAAQNLGNVLKKTRSSFVRKVARPQETSSITNETLSIMIPGQLGVIKEDSPTFLRPKEAEKPRKSSASLEIKVSASTVSRQSLQGKRSATIPKEPNFHAIHTPKSCTRRVA
ncbi:hypothetical protein POPTR_001G287800v4 [Populus trichocarpa]|uniref:Uncharacterized protein n=2 Tax=Populus trichocarpa TaxID=3694 RepID=A0ACC0TME3_POPTR|nr:uncharacterized protein LOC7470773 isoform X1 [Populus trichocarpa]KAI9402549.1 hypothetical protein POPTR_001G287800v4 [Populus trichocarpa]